MKTFRKFLLQENEDDPLDHSNTVSHTDKDGYTIHIIPTKPGRFIGDERWPEKVQQERWAEGYPARHGQMIIQHPNGEQVKGGYWMNQPEAGWTHNGINLAHEYWNVNPRHWENLPLKDRLTREAHHQATAYDSLKDQFNWRKSLIKESPETDEEAPYHNTARHFESNDKDFAGFEHVSTLPSGHRFFKERGHDLDDMTEPHFFFVAHPEKKLKTLTLITNRDQKRNHRVEYVGINNRSELDPGDVLHHMVAQHGMRLTSNNGKHSAGVRDAWTSAATGREGSEMHLIDRKDVKHPLEKNFDDNYKKEHASKRFFLIPKVEK